MARAPGNPVTVGATAPGGPAADARQALDAFVASAVSLSDLLQSVTAIGTELLGARFGAFVECVGERPEATLSCVSGASRDEVGGNLPRRALEAALRSEVPVHLEASAEERAAGGVPCLVVGVRLRAGELVGVLLFAGPEGRAFAPRDEALAARVAAGAALAVENARLVAAARVELEERGRAELRLAAEHAVTRILAGVSSLEEAAPRILETLRASLDASVAELWMPDEEAAILRRSHALLAQPAPALEAFDRSSREIGFARGVGLPGRVWELLEPAWIAELSRDPNFPRACVATESGLRSGVAFPIATGDEFFGVMEFFTRRRLEPDPPLLRMMAAIGSEIGQFIYRRRAEAALRDSQQQLADFVENASIGLHWVGPDGRILWANRAELDLLGYTEEEYIGHHIAEYHADEPVIADILDRLAGNEELHRYEARLRCKDGSIKDVLISSNVFWKDGRFEHTRCFTLDITARKRAEEGIAESEIRKSAMLSSALDCIITMDHEGRIVEFNPAAERTFGHKRAEVVGRPVAEVIIPARLRERHRLGMKQYLETGEARILDRRLELPALRADGTEFPCELAVTCVRMRHGEPFFTGYLRDITERKRTEEELQLRTRQLAEADRRKDEFLAMLAHELRGPLAPIRNTVELLSGRAEELDAEVLRGVEVVGRQCTQLQHLVDDLLDLARITSGRVELKKQPLGLAELLARAAEACQPALEARRHALRITPPEAPLFVEGDPVRLVQVLSNLLDNAIKYTDEGGSIELSATDEAGEAVVRVRDNGHGIAPDMLPWLFEAFTQADRGLDRAQGGLGLGLSLVRGLVEKHGGRVEVHSEGLEKGSEFVVRLPLCEPPAAPVREARSAAPPTAGRRILVVDDHVDAGDSLAALLRRRGHRVEVARDGAAALEAAARFEPDVVLLDIGLPGMDGYEVARRLRAESGKDGRVLVALTGYGQEQDRRRAFESGFDHHLLKPVAWSALAPLLEGRDPDDPGA